MARTQLLVVSLSVMVTFTLTASVPPPTPDPSEADIKVLSRQLVDDVRELASEAKKGMAVKTIYKNALELQSDASDLIQSLPSDVSECETNLVIKMAAVGVGSHEVLTLLLADDAPAVLNGRLALSLAFLERVAQQLEDELALSADVGPHLAAIVFGANATSSIAETADEVIKPVITTTTNDDDTNNDDDNNNDDDTNNNDVDDNNNNDVDDNNNDDDTNNVVRRQITFGNGFSVGPTDGLKWTSSNGRTSVNFKPTPFSKGGGAEFGLGLKSENGRTSLNLKASRNPYEGSGVRGSLGLTTKDGRTDFSLTPSWTQKGGPAIGAELTRTFAKGRGSLSVGASHNKYDTGVNFKVGLRF